MQTLDNLGESIEDVSDTALWVAYYRAEESRRPDALFRDPLAATLSGDRGQKIADSMAEGSAHTRMNVVVRTMIIDEFVQTLVADGIEQVINLGAGLDTRPYRLQLPPNVHWIEVDYPKMIEYKSNLLRGEKPTCQLERVGLDLGDRPARQAFFRSIDQGGRRTIALTEGVLPYLTPAQVSDFAEDIYQTKSIEGWIADYMSPHVYKYIQTSARSEKMKKAPFQFFPPEGLDFFKSRGWTPETIRYIPEVARRTGRMVPPPWWIHLIAPFMSQQKKDQFLKTTGYMILRRQGDGAVSVT